MNQLAIKKCRTKLTADDRLEPAQAQTYLNELDGWQISADALLLSRRFSFKNFKQTMFFINALAFICDKEGHHPDAKFGFNYCEVTFTTHDAAGLSDNDFICAAKLNQLLS